MTIIKKNNNDNDNNALHSFDTCNIERCINLVLNNVLSIRISYITKFQ